MILGTGIDLVEISRIKKILDKENSSFADRFFHPNEVTYCQSKANPEQHFAARFAAKEAFLKALGTGISEGIELSKIEISHSSKGVPNFKIHSEKMIKLLDEKNINKIHLSISHTDLNAIAQVIFEN
jgi:holo-[acyl-carrier protein] synthase